MKFVEAVVRIRNEHPECGGLVQAKRIVERYGTYEAAKAALMEGKSDPTTNANYTTMLRHSPEPRNEAWYLREMAKKSYAEVGHTKEGQIHANRLERIAKMIEAVLES